MTKGCGQLKLRSLLMFIMLFSMLILPASAAYEWSNEITVGTDDMVWEYTEKYSDDRSVIFKSFIDVEFGDNDNFVSAWELLKADVKTSRSFQESIEKKMDVKIDNSSKNVTLLGVETTMSNELLGPTNERKDIVNNYQVLYEFRTPLTEDGSNMWFQGEPDTDVTISLPSELKFISVDGIDNESIKEDEDGTHISGEFGFTGEVTVYFSVEEPEIPVMETDVNTSVSTSDAEDDTTSFLERIFPGITDDLLDKLRSDTFKSF
ncbi:hypothetical protein [Methanolobus profundi]|uniref:Uncharacterized protein n=1 Tax=Methanolobus profundi TaxID=487685 RepID=A0A1I4R8G1_9EURY|nr:hypothetical protein [Methanolobus profundi]SFM48465.1 hypothetical protein SAMN04488696_1423 [Methanolobus profundi]